MPNKKSALKELYKAQRRTAANKDWKKKIKDTSKRIEKALAASDIEKARSVGAQVVQLLDKAAKRNTIHKNEASRKKSALMKALNKTSKT